MTPPLPQPYRGSGEHGQSSPSSPLASETLIETQVSSFLLLPFWEGKHETDPEMVNYGEVRFVAS